jgi:DNA-binding transcriptional LysR family regulator
MAGGLAYLRFANNPATDQIAAMRVAKLVRQLESHLRVKLLQRTMRRVTLTPEGAAYYERISRVLADLEDIEADLTNARTSPGVGCGWTSARRWPIGS